MKNTIIVGDVRDTLPTLPADSVQCCVTSPPYFGLRDYGHDGQIGLEDTPEAYVATLVEVFREVRRVLRDDGTLWLNLGDSYGSFGGNTYSGFNERWSGTGGPGSKQDATLDGVTTHKADTGLRPKNLIGIPWRVAFALQADGWYLRQDIIWHKPNPMPESVRDRCTKAHEYVFLLSKSQRYFYDAEAIKVDASSATIERNNHGFNGAFKGQFRGTPREKRFQDGRPIESPEFCKDGRANRRSVWTVTTKPFSGAHFATMPPELAETCILAGSKPGDLVLDPFGGAGTTAVVAAAHGRDWLLCEINPQYAAECAWPRIKQGWSAESKRPCRPAARGQRRLFEE